MIEIDAGQGEGGGQILRCALALSAIRGVRLRVRSIRAHRKTPGLQPQHLTSVMALARICGAEVAGAALGSQELSFTPGAIRAGQYQFDIGTAGSTTLALQAILLPLAVAEGPSTVTLIGGTHVPWSPPADYLEAVLMPRLAQIGVRVRLEVGRSGLYPRGGGRLSVEVAGGALLTPVTWVRRSGIATVRGISAVAGLPLEAAVRQRAYALERLQSAGHDAVIETRDMPAWDRGRFLFLSIQDENGSVGFSALGGIGETPEQMGSAAVEALLEFARTDATCDPFLADQLVVPLALAAGTSRFTTSRITSHLVTAVSLVQQILACPAQVRGDLGSPGSVTIEGVGARVPAKGNPSTTPRDSLSSEDEWVRGTNVRKARAADGPPIQRLLAHFAARGELLHRTLNEVYQHLRDFVVCEVDGQIVGVCALWLYWEDLAEVRSLAVHESYGGRGLGQALVGACLEEAAGLGIQRVFALTYRPGFFERLGFRTLDKRELPQKIWKDCIRCAKFTCCDEVALIRDIAPPPRQK
jgi:RNA 3'-terminal phosphate cyclase (ATP)